MFVQKVPHIKDQFLTQERASMELESGQIAVGWYTNEQDSQSVVHSHPYYELVLPLVGSNVRYSVDGNIYDINLGEMIIFPARCYHAGMFNITDKISERLIAQIDAELWQEALLASGLVAPTWLGQLVILDQTPSPHGIYAAYLSGWPRPLTYTAAPSTWCSGASWWSFCC